MRRLARPDPLILLVGGVVIVLASLGVFTALGLSPDEVAQLEAGLIMIVSAIRMWLTRRANADPTQDWPIPPGPAPVPTPVPTADDNTTPQDPPTP